MTKLNLFNDYHKLEDRVTHAFLATLNSLEAHSVQKIFRRLFEGEENVVKGKNLNFDVQNPTKVSSAKFKKAKQGYLVTITSPDVETKKSKNKSKSSRADGWIFDGENLCLIESKLDSELSEEQLKNHQKILSDLLQKHIKPDDIPKEELTWAKISRILNKMIDDEDDFLELEKVVINQFLEFLYMEGVTMNFEKLYNTEKYEKVDIQATWESNHPNKTLDKLKKAINCRLHDSYENLIEFKKERRKQTRTHYFWQRLFTFDENTKTYTKTKLAKWRGTVYINPDEVSVDLMIFRPGQGDLDFFNELFFTWESKFKNSEDRRRIYFYLTKYGKRRDIQGGRDYRYAEAEFCLGEHGEGYKFEKDNFPIKVLNELIKPKQIGFKYSIFNPRGSYWDKDQETINHNDAQLLRDCDKVVEKFSEFLNNSLEVITKFEKSG